MKVDKQTLDDLEFTTIQSWLKNLAISDSAKNQLDQLLPSSNRKEVIEEL